MLQAAAGRMVMLRILWLQISTFALSNTGCAQALAEEDSNGRGEKTVVCFLGSHRGESSREFLLRDFDPRQPVVRLSRQLQPRQLGRVLHVGELLRVVAAVVVHGESHRGRER
jgi:hypothetical protein